MQLPYRLFVSLLLPLMLLISTVSYAGDANQQLQSLLTKHQGKVIYLDFWASWCVPCRKSFPWMKQIQTKYQGQDFTVISINVDAEPELADKFLKKNPINFPVVFDPTGEIAARYGLKGMPTSYLLDKDGAVKVEHVGFFTHQQSLYEQQIKWLIGASDE